MQRRTNQKKRDTRIKQQKADLTATRGERDITMNNITNEQFDSKLADILSDMTGAELLSISGLYEVVAEELNNKVLEALEEEQED